MNNELKDYKEGIARLMFERIPSMFPTFEFKKVRGNWQSVYHHNGNKDRGGRAASVIKSTAPSYVFNNGSEDGIGIFDFYAKVNGRPLDDFFGILDEIADKIGAERYSSEKREEKRREVEFMQAIHERARTALYTPEGAAVLDYLKTERGYSDELISKMGFGVLTSAIANDLNSHFEGYAPKASAFPLIVPLYEGQRVDAFKFRRITSDADKYRNPSNIEKKIRFRSIRSAVVLVEGEIDALHANAVGFDNVASVGGLDITKEQGDDLRRRGVEKVVFCLDSESDETKRGNVAGKIKKAISELNKLDISVEVVELPIIDGKKTDLDSYLLKEGAEWFRYLTATGRPKSGPSYLAEVIAEQGKKEGKTGAQIARAVIRSSLDFRPLERREMYSILRDLLSYEVTEQDIADEAAAIEEERKNEQAREAVKKYSRIISSAAASGDVEGVTKATTELSSALAESRERESFDEIYRQATDSKTYRERLAATTAGIPTGFGLRQGKNVERLQIEPAALTYVAARTSHGKSRFLLNLAADIIERREGKVLYFVYEGTAAETALRSLVTYYGKGQRERKFPDISINPYRTISTYYREGTTEYFLRDSFAAFNVAEGEFWRMIDDGKIAFFGVNYSVEELVRNIGRIAKKEKISAVFIDYIQKLRSEKRSSDKKDELRNISDELLRSAVSLDVPFILAAQLNRETRVALDISTSNIADCAEIEKDANTILALFDFAVDKGYYDDASELLQRIPSENPEDLRGKLFVRLLKNRFGSVGIWDLLDVDRSTGYVVRNLTDADDELRRTAKEKEIQSAKQLFK